MVKLSLSARSASTAPPLPLSPGEVQDALNTSGTAGLGESESPILGPVERRKRGLALRAESKAKRQRGEAYIGRDGVPHEAKTFEMFHCKCRLSCGKLDEVRRRQIFQRFWNLGSHSAQSTFLAGCVAAPEKEEKFANRTYRLDGVVVCKNMFCKTLAISRNRADGAFSKASLGLPSPDKRGRHPPKNRIDETVRENALKFMDAIPRYKSHYSNSERRYFHPDLKVKDVASAF